MATHCLVVNDRIKELAQELPHESAISIATLIGLWQDRLKQMGVQDYLSHYPTVEELRAFKDSLRVKTGTLKVGKQSKALLNMDPVLKTKRARNIANRFHQLLSYLQQKYEKDGEYLDFYQILKKEGTRKLLLQLRDSYDPKLITLDAVEKQFRKLYPGKTDQWYIDKAVKQAEHRRRAYQQILDNFTPLLEEATEFIARNDQILIRYNSSAVDPFKDMDLEDSNNQIEDMDKKEELATDAWLMDTRKLSSYNRATALVRATLFNLPKYNSKNYIALDDLLEPERMDVDVSYRILQKILDPMTEASQMLPLLKKNKSKFRWLGPLISRLEKDKNLHAQFYRSFRNSTNSYIIQVRKFDPELKRNRTQIIDTLRDEEKKGLLQQTLEYRENGVQLNPNQFSIYNVTGGSTSPNILSHIQGEFEKVRKEIRSISKYKNYEERRAALYHIMEEQADPLARIMRAIGIDITGDQIFEVYIQLEQPFKAMTGTLSVLNSLVYNIISDPHQWLSRHSTNLLFLFNTWFPDSFTPQELSTTQQGSTYYSKVFPSYIDTVFEKLKQGAYTEEEYQEYLQERYYKSSYWFNDNDGLPYKEGPDGERIVSFNDATSWLQYLKESPEARNQLQKVEVLYRDGLEYANWTEDMTNKVIVDQYFGNPDYENQDWAYFPVPVFSNAQSIQFIKFKRIKADRTHSLIENAYSKYKHVIIQELNRINLVKKMNADDSINKIANFNKNGDKFLFFDMLNNMVIENIDPDVDGMSFYDAITKAQTMGKTTLEEALYNAAVKYTIDIARDEYRQELEDLGLIEYFKENDYNIEDFVVNHMFATTQIIQLAVTDLAFFKNAIDFQKRFKGLYSPTQRLDTTQTGKTGKYIILYDNIIASESLREITQVVNTRVQEGTLSQKEADRIIEKFRNMNNTDGQSYRTLHSYRMFNQQLGTWTPAMERAYQRWIKGGGWKPSDFNLMFNPIKPMYFSNEEYEVHLGSEEQQNKKDYIIKSPVFIKNSEFPLMAEYKETAGVTGDSPTLVALNKFMTKYGIDSIHFQSCVKVGSRCPIDISQVNPNELADFLAEQCFENPEDLKSPEDIGKLRPTEVIHTINYEDMGLSQPTPEHVIDAIQHIGSQVISVLTADLIGKEIKLDGKIYKGEELIQEIADLTSKQLDMKTKEINELFGNGERFMERLRESIKQDNGFNSMLLELLTPMDDGSYRPLSNPVLSKKLQSVALAIIRNELVKRDVKGGSVVQVSNFGFSDDLHMHWSTDPDTGKLQIDYMECYMPAYSREFYKYADPKTGIIDITKIPEELLDVIGYRIPTEGKYSILKLKIKGFTSQMNGGVAILPSELTTLNDSDFDELVNVELKLC